MSDQFCAPALPDRHLHQRPLRSAWRTLLPVLSVAVLLPASRVGRPEPLTSASAPTDLSPGLVVEGQRPDPTDFSSEELRDLQRRFGVHGPQPALAQLFTDGLDHWAPLRSHTLDQLEPLAPVVRREARRHNLNPMLLAAILYDEIKHAKPGENTPLAVHSGLFRTHGPAQLSVEELIHQKLLPPDPSPAQLAQARDQLLDPERNVELLAGLLARLSRALGYSSGELLEASTSPRAAHRLATLAYLHNGKLDYPARILRYMQDPALHALIYGARRTVESPLI